MNDRTSLPWPTDVVSLIPARRGLIAAYRKEQHNIFLYAMFVLFYDCNIHLAEGALTLYWGFKLQRSWGTAWALAAKTSALEGNSEIPERCRHGEMQGWKQTWLLHETQQVHREPGSHGAPTACKQAVRAPSAREQGDPSSWALPALQPQESQLAPGKEYFFSTPSSHPWKPSDTVRRSANHCLAEKQQAQWTAGCASTSWL